MLEHERPEEVPRRPRLCATCGRARPIESPAVKALELVCVECGATSEDGAGWKAEVAVDHEQQDEDELVVYCPACWDGEFGDE
jgi:hypothetical protein